MGKPLTVLLDLDGTLVNTMSDEYAKYRDGKADINIDEVPLFDGAVDFVKTLQNSGHEVFIVSDSHPRYVVPIAEKIFNVKSLSLAYKPTYDKTLEFIKKHSSIQYPSNEIVMIGDNTLDIQTARKLYMPSIFIEHKSDYRPEVWKDGLNTGPTFYCKSFSEIIEVLKDRKKHLLNIEGLKYNFKSFGSIEVGGVKYRTHGGRRLYKLALARQEVGSCDIFARSDWYGNFSSNQRTTDFLKKLSVGVGNYIKYFQEREDISFDMISYVSDKETTVPRNKMKQFAEMIDIGIPIEKTTYWRDNINGSIRNQPKRRNRYDFVKQNIYVEVDSKYAGKNIVMIDDQITTGATMDAVTEMLWNKGFNHVLYLSLFKITDEVSTGKVCSKCGKEMSIRNRKRDGGKFYSCVPERYGGTGCGNIENYN